MARSPTTYRSKWKAGPTTVIRVPESLAPRILEFARKLDTDTEALALRESGRSYRTAEDLDTRKPVNVASVPQRSPFRYPGGKTWLVPYIRAWLRSKTPRPAILIEPFAGGAIVGLTAGFESLADHVVLVENDPYVAAVWQIVFGGQAEWLANAIERFELTEQNVLRVLRGETSSQRERAFATILRNRVQRGGIMAAGAGLVKHGENGKGLSSRWYPKTLARRIREISEVRSQFLFIEGDGVEIIRRYADVEEAVFFVDPPYTVAARRLYHHWQVDHRALFAVLSRVKGDVLLTYDHTREILMLAEGFGFKTQAIAMKNTHHAKMSELLVGRNLEWLKRTANGRESRPQNWPATLAFPR